jgi:DNA-binding CsgD family transcriptional regulator
MSRTAEQLNKNLSILENLARERPGYFPLEEIQQIEKECGEIKWMNGIGRCRNLYGLYQNSIGNKEEARQLFNATMSLASQLDDISLLTSSTYDLALVNFHMSNLSDAYTYIKEAEHYAQICGDKYFIVSCHNVEALIRSRYGEHDAAIILLQIAQEIAKNYVPELVGTILLNSVEIPFVNGEFRKAREYAVEYLKLKKVNGQISDRLNALIRLATIDVELNDISSAEKLINEAQQLITTKNSIIYATMVCLRGSLAVKKKSYTEGLDYFQRALELYRKFQKPRLESNALVLAGEAHLASKNTETAIKCGLKAWKLALKAEDRYMTKESLQLLYEAHKAAKDIENSLKYLEMYNELARQDAVKQFENRLAFVNLKTEYEKKQAEAEETRRKAEAFAKELEAKELELTERTRNLIRQTESIAKLREDLRAIIKSAPGNAIAKQVAERLRALPDSHSNWEEFEKHFISVHPDFEKNLIERFPKLTKMERRICILLRLNLMSVDMAKLLILSERNIENHRHRLRKKLSVGSEVNLQEFLNSID